NGIRLWPRQARRPILGISTVNECKEEQAMRNKTTMLIAAGFTFGTGLATAAGTSTGVDGYSRGDASAGVVTPSQPNSPVDTVDRTMPRATGDAAVRGSGRTGAGAGVENRFNATGVDTQGRA